MRNIKKLKFPRKNGKKDISKKKTFFKAFKDVLHNIEQIIREKVIIPIKTSKFSKFYKQNRKKFNLILLVITIIFLVFSIILVTINLNSILNVNQSKVRYAGDTPIKYIGIEDGYITETLIVQTGDALPEISDYFSPNYPLADDVSISYYNDSKEELSVTDFTYQDEDSIYVKGYTRIISVIISNNGKDYSTNLQIRDTTAPDIKLSGLSINAGDEIDAYDFISYYYDNSRLADYSAYILTDIDTSKAGDYEVEIGVCDFDNNCTSDKTNLTINKKTSSSNNNSSNSGSSNKKPSNGSSSGNNSSNNGSSSGSNSSSGNNSSNNGSSSGNNSSNSGSSSGNNTSSSSGGSKIVAANARKTEGTFSEENFDLVINHYGTTETIHYDYVKYIRYDDGFAKVLDSKGKSTTIWNYSGFNSTSQTNLALMKRDAISLIHNDESFYQSLYNTFLNNTNKIRADVGAKSLVLDNDLCYIAQIRLYEILYGNTESHTRPNGKSWTTLLDDYGYTFPNYGDGKPTRGEIFVCGASNNKQAFDSLRNSQSHYEIMVNSLYTKTGVGRFTLGNTTCWVQILAR